MEQVERVYFCVEVRCVNGKPLTNTKRSNAMSLYVCYFGSGADTQIQEEGCFLVTDDQERLWFCKEVTDFDPEKQPDYAEQFFRMGYLAHKLGINDGGTMFYGNAADQDDLRKQLSEKK